jgi:hypothetical protein
MAKPSAGKQPAPKDAYPTSPAARRRAEQLQQRQASTQRSTQKQRNKRKVEGRKNHDLWYILGFVVIAVALVIGVFIYLGTRPSGSGTIPTPTPVSSSVLSEVTGVPASTLAAVGSGSSQVQNPLTPIKNGPPLKGSAGHPEVFYEGAEYCPYCAAERWGMIVALSRFGTFHNLSQITSSSSDVYPSTATFSFYKSSYTSQYVDFVPLEVESQQGTPLQVPTPAQQQIINTYNTGGSFPFIDIANKYTITGASYDPQLLQGLDAQTIADSLSNPNSPIAQGILGTANYLTAAICEATNQQPGSVCSAAPIPAIEKTLSGSSGSNKGSSGMIPSAPVALVRPSWYRG